MKYDLLARGTLRTLLGAALMTAGVFAAAPANATITWNLDPSQCSESGSVCTAGFAATATFDFSNIDANSIDAQITVANNSVAGAHLSAFGFSVPPGLTADADGLHDGATANGALPTGWNIDLGAWNLGFLNVASPADAEVCLTLATNGSCFGSSGNPSVVANSIDPGEELTFNLVLDNLNDDGSTAFATVADYETAFGSGNPIFFRFKPLDTNAFGAGSVKFGGVQVSVPEPGTMALFGIGLLGIGLAARRRRVKA